MSRIIWVTVLLSLLVFSCSSPAVQTGEANDTTGIKADLVAARQDTAPPAVQKTRPGIPPSMSSHDLKTILAMDPLLSAKKRAGFVMSDYVYDLGYDSLWIVAAFEPEEKSSTGQNKEITLHAFQKNPALRNVLKIEYSDCGHINDTVFDANFDGRLDYMIYEYYCNGCCPRDGRIVYLTREWKLDSNYVFHLFNPYFDPPRKAIYEMGYGRSPFLDISKSVWRGDSLVLTESIRHNVDLGSEDLKDRYPPFVRTYEETGEEELLTEVPDEYTRMTEYFWF